MQIGELSNARTIRHRSRGNNKARIEVASLRHDAKKVEFGTARRFSAEAEATEGYSREKVASVSVVKDQPRGWYIQYRGSRGPRFRTGRLYCPALTRGNPRRKRGGRTHRIPLPADTLLSFQDPEPGFLNYR